jgi:alkaline phosphatase
MYNSLTRNNSDELVATATQSGINFFAGDKFSSSKYNEYVSQYVDNDYYVGTNFDDDGWMENDKVMFQLDIKPEQNSSNDYVMFSEIIENALNYLAQDPDGFVLMAEGAYIDKKSHSNELLPMIKELLAFDLGVKVALDWAKNRDDTAIIVTADHETGGLSFDSSINKNNMFSTPALYSWSSLDHTGTNVNCYILGADIDFSGFLEFKSSTKIKNTDIFKIMKGFVG